jgi:hypothetical protein
MKLNEIRSRFTEKSEIVHSEELHDVAASINYKIFCTFRYGPELFYPDSGPEQEVIREKIDKIVLSDLELTDLFIDNPMELSYKELSQDSVVEKIKNNFSKNLDKENLSVFRIEFSDTVIKHFLNEIKKRAQEYLETDIV